MKNLKDLCLAFQHKQWWNIRSKHTLWGGFIKAKYCQRSNPKCKKWDFGDSLNLKHMIHNRFKVEQHILWQLNSRNCSFWWDNWNGERHLSQFSSNSHMFDDRKVVDFWVEEQWNYRMLVQQAPLTIWPLS